MSFTLAFTLCLASGWPVTGGAKDLNRHDFDRALSNKFCVIEALSSQQLRALRTFYASDEFSYLWVKDEKVNESAQILLSELARSSAHGLKPEFYHRDRLVELSTAGGSDDLVCFEVLLSQAFVLYANDIANGFIGSDRYPEHTLVVPVNLTPDSLFEKSRSPASLKRLLKSLLTTDSRYVRLVSKLAEFLRLEKLKAWPEIRNLGSSKNPALDPTVVRELLLFTGDLEAKDVGKAERGSVVYKRAIAKFQARHGLSVNQKIDATTFKEMAMPLAKRIQLVRINLERRRWQNRDLGERYIYVNTAGQSVRFVVGGEKTGSSKLVSVGRLKELPTFTGSVNAIYVSDESNLELEIQANPESNAKNTFTVNLELEGDKEENLSLLFGQASLEDLPSFEKGRVLLSKPINAYVTYLTVWANKDGSINFRPDIFDRDEKIAELLGLTVE